MKKQVKQMMQDNVYFQQASLQFTWGTNQYNLLTSSRY
jgi:hypothetical protein